MSKERLLLLILLGVDALILLLEIGGLSISHREAKTFFEADSFLHYILHLSTALFGQNDFALRLPMLLMHLLAVVLFYRVTSDYLSRTADRLWMVAIFMLLPGVTSAALLVDSSSFVIFAIFFYVYLAPRYRAASDLWLLFLVGLDMAFALLYLGIFFYALQQRDRRQSIVALLLFGTNLYFFGFDTHGIPKGHFLDVLGLYAAIFSPIVFLYLAYTLFRRVAKRKLDLLWYLSAVPLLASLLLSFRQEIYIEMFAPYLLLAMPLAGRTFFHSYRVRLKPYRSSYRLVFGISVGILVLHALVILFNKELYRFVDYGPDHFAYRQHVAKELTAKLRAADITCVDADDRKMQLRLRFYGIGQCDTWQLAATGRPGSQNVTIGYRNRSAYPAYVTKIPKNGIPSASNLN
jgi:hypothetical protein